MSLSIIKNDHKIMEMSIHTLSPLSKPALLKV